MFLGIIASVEHVGELQLAHVAEARDGLGLDFGFGQSRRSMAASMAMMAMTTSSSIRVKPRVTRSSSCSERLLDLLLWWLLV